MRPHNFAATSMRRHRCRHVPMAIGLGGQSIFAEAGRDMMCQNHNAYSHTSATANASRVRRPRAANFISSADRDRRRPDLRSTAGRRIRRLKNSSKRRRSGKVNRDRNQKPTDNVVGSCMGCRVAPAYSYSSPKCAAHICALGPSVPRPRRYRAGIIEEQLAFFGRPTEIILPGRPGPRGK